jgi:DNA-binding LacI/PurR family transcriptional regulator
MHHPPLTTIHQPLRSMGQVAASTLLSLIRNEVTHPHPSAITVYPRLVLRKSTSHAALHSETASEAADADSSPLSTNEAAG